MKKLLSFLNKLYTERTVIFQLVRRDFQKEYLGSILGIIWAFAQPLLLVFVMWFVFTFGLRQGRSSETVPFVLWLMCGMFLWSFISETIGSSSGVIRQYSYLVTKVKFRVGLLPLVKILSSLIAHSFFLVLLLILLMANGCWPTWYWLQVIYYLFAAITLCAGIACIASALNVFAKDVSLLIHVLTRIGFWFTPIFWKLKNIPAKYHVLVKLNPIYYLIQGYRDSLIYGVGFWQHPLLAVYFWVIALALVFIGRIVFKRLRPHFADVL